MKWIVFLFVAPAAIAGISTDVIIKGKIGATFDESRVEVIDSFGQKYLLPKSAFSKDFLLREGNPFSVEVDEKEIENQKIKVKK